MQCVILAGGLGSRMKRYTTQLPKSLIPVHGHPFLKWQLTLLEKNKINNVLLCIGYQGQSIQDYIQKNSFHSFDIHFSNEGNDLRGTGGALRLAIEQGLIQDTFFLLYGDSYLPTDFLPIWRHFEKRSENALMTLLQNKEQWIPSNVCFDGQRVTMYSKESEKPKPPCMTYVDYGLSLFRRDFIKNYIPPNEKVDLSTILKIVSAKKELAGYEVFERFYEIGSEIGLQEFEKHLRATSF